MARPKSTHRGYVFHRQGRTAERLLPPAIQDAIAAGDPALTHIAHEVMRAKSAGLDVTDPLVLTECVEAGRLRHNAAKLGFTA